MENSKYFNLNVPTPQDNADITPIAQNFTQIDKLLNNRKETNDATVSVNSTWSSDKIAKELKSPQYNSLRITIVKSPINGQFVTQPLTRANEIRNWVNAGGIVQLWFDDTQRNTGEQVYGYETFDKGDAIFRRVVVEENSVSRIIIKVHYDGYVTIEEVSNKQASNIVNDIIGDYRTPAQKLGLTGDLSVGASLGVLADVGNLYVWKKTTYEIVTEYEYSIDVGLETTEKLVPGRQDALITGYSKCIATEADAPGSAKLLLSDANLLVGTPTKYYMRLSKDKQGGYYNNEASSMVFYIVDLTGSSGKYSLVTMQRITAKSTPLKIPQFVSTSYVVSTNRHAYPDSGGTDTEEYQYVGQVGDRMRAEIVSYIGTGVYGETHPNSITASFPIKMVITCVPYQTFGDPIYRFDSSTNYGYSPDGVLIFDTSPLTDEYQRSTVFEIINSHNQVKMSKNRHSIYWYATTQTNQMFQLNWKDVKYSFLVIG